ncbi:MAG TPA: LLM class flavin-dependent oxidoreductase [Thermomicrobiaceae bacterium]|nr:LLM class flavin-dependent oxidoreductase [Thermomicrobiaceae bacterium]
MRADADHPVRFGISLPNRAVLFGLPAETLLTTAEQADRSGFFDSVWVGDNFLSKPRLEAIVTLSALAARTRRLRLGTICLASFPLRHPLPLALQWASLDLLSGGRTILAVCLGGSDRMGPKFAAELAAMGVRSAERAPRLEEGIDLLRRLWGPEPVTYHGRFYTLDDVDLQPKPAQARVPIIIAVNPPEGGDPAVEERALRRVARIADGWQTDGTPPALFRERWQRIREYADEAGRADEVSDASLHLMVNIDDDPDRAYRSAVAFLDHYYGGGVVSAEKLDSWLAFGPPDAVVEKIAAFVEAGCTTVVARFTALDQAGQLGRFLEEVAPRLRERFPVVVGGERLSGQA